MKQPNAIPIPLTYQILSWHIICKVKSLSHVRLLVTPWAVACQAPLSMGFSREEYRSGLPFPSPGDLPDLRIRVQRCESPALQADSLSSVKAKLKNNKKISTTLKQNHQLILCHVRQRTDIKICDNAACLLWVVSAAMGNMAQFSSSF